MDASKPAENRRRRDELVGVAYRRLATAGFEGLRTRDVAAEAGINVATLHYYFPTKEALIRAVVGHAMSRFASTLSGEGDPRAQLRAHFRNLRRLLREEPELPAVMGELAMRSTRDPAIEEILRTSDRAWHAWLVHLLGDDPYAEGKAAVIMSTLRGLFVLPGSADDPERVDAALAAMEAMLGIG
jgi:AcrR family transcriptional regulator